MNYIEEIVSQVEQIYTGLDNDAYHFRVQSGLKCRAR
jgi:hypothetical protein